MNTQRTNVQRINTQRRLISLAIQTEEQLATADPIPLSSMLEQLVDI